jgi:L-ascorbate metabolism protein UlaG (beta-lactamase superfamily)
MRLKGARNTVPVRRWQSIRIGDFVVTAVPATHIARTVGYVVQTQRATVYFSGDTFYRPFMAEIGRRFPIDVALIPVTTYRVPMTMGEAGAVRAVRDLGAETVIPIHLGVQPRSPLLRTRQTPQSFEKRLRQAAVAAEVVLLGEGQSWDAAPVTETEPAVELATRAG